MKAKILEIFRSIQGEGKYAGVSQVFVRFYECNMHCVWCDTPHSIGPLAQERLPEVRPRYVEQDIDEIFRQIADLWDGCHSVSLTGGEPLLQVEAIKELIPRFKKAKMPIYLETNGVLPTELKEVIDGVDIVAMDMKLPSSTEWRPFWQEHEDFLKIALQKDVFIKTVISSKTEKEDVLKAIEIVGRIDPNVLFILQPNTYDLNNGVMKKCLDYQMMCFQKLNNVRIMPQMHKFMKVR